MKKLLYILLFIPVALFAQVNYSLSFDGVDDFVDIGVPNGMNPTGSHTFLLFSKNQTEPCIAGMLISEHLGINTIPPTNNIFSYGYRACETNCPEGNCMGMDFYANSVYTTSYYGDNWDYWAFVYNASTLERKIYLNGVLLADDIASGAYQGTFDLIFGAQDYNMPPGMVSYFNGFIDDVSLWAHPLSIDEIQLYMSSCINGNEFGLIGHWNFNEGYGDTIYDISTNGNHGIRNGPSYSNDSHGNNCFGCKNPDAINYDENTIEEDEQLCIYSQDYVHGLWNQVDDGAIEFSDYQEQATTSLSSMQQALDTWNTTIDLSAGWNMFGYGCPSSIDVAEGLSNHTDNIVITKDNAGSIYMPEFGFNGIGDFTPGFGYQIKLTEAIEGFSLCDWYVNDIPEDNIVSLQDSIINMHNTNCIEDGYCSFDNENQICISPENGYDCFGYELISYQVGDMVEGGIIFYIDETGQHGLVASMEDLTEGATDPYGSGFIGYEWGCLGGAFDGANGTSLGTGYQNTIDIVNQECSTTNGSITAAKAAFDAEIGGYSDWYLPSFDELTLMYNSIGYSSGNIGGFEANDNSNPYYWSSSKRFFNHAWSVEFLFGNMFNANRETTLKVRPIRSF